MNGLIKIPIAVLKIGEQRVQQTNLEFPEGPITFKLISGSGPVIITGLQAEDNYVDDMAGEEDLGDEEEVKWCIFVEFSIQIKYFFSIHFFS